MGDAKPFLSVVVCCHNSAALLPQTLGHLAAQVVDPSVKWEVVIVDNGSTDGSADVAVRSWSPSSPAPLHVVREPKLGLAYARARGIDVSRGEIISFVDDDNWLCRRWVQTAADVMRAHPDAGALGGIVEPQFESDCPPWFPPVAYLYATGPEGEPSGDVTGIHMLCGAGLSVRRSALADIRTKGFRMISVDRQGTNLGAGGDSEMTYCLRLSGWRIRIDPRLRLQHFLPVRRLSWSYAQQLAYGSAFATPERDALVYACKPPRSGVTYLLRLLRERWFWQTGLALGKLIPAWRGIMKRWMTGSADGDLDVLKAEFLLGRVNGLIAMRLIYNPRAKEIRQVMARMEKQTRG